MTVLGLLCVLTSTISGNGSEPSGNGSAPLVPAARADGGDLWDAVAEGRTWLHFRYRFEHVDADGFASESDASTLRTVLGHETEAFHGLRLFLEFEDVSVIGDENYNSTVNGVVGHPVVADPDGAELNQGYVRYEGLKDTQIAAGRQELALDNHRFVGNVGWRQNHQSFDALSVTHKGWAQVDATYAYLFNVNRIFGDASPAGDEQMDSHLLHLARNFDGVGRASLFAYLLDFDTSLALSTTTVGGRLEGSRKLGDSLDLLYTGEYAMQQDAGSNPVDVDADYYRAELGARWSRFAVRLGDEFLSGSGAAGDKFTTPLATLHKFNGFADVFLATPDTGLDDRYMTVSGTFGDVKAQATFHDFTADSGGADYGSEIDAVVTVPFGERTTLGFKLAQFDADSAGFADVTTGMVWFSVNAL